MNLREAYLERPVKLQRELEHEQGKIRTWAGMYIDPFDPDPDVIRIDDIAHALSLICRYNGHVDRHYSVAQHSLEVVRYLEDHLCPTPVLLHGLLHDAAEAYMGDLPSPLKHNIAMVDYDGAELRLLEKILERYIPYRYHQWDKVKEADDAVYQMERISFLFPFETAEDMMYEKYRRSVIVPKEPAEVEQEFLFKFRTLAEPIHEGYRRGVPV